MYQQLKSVARDNIGMRMSEGEKASSDENELKVERINMKGVGNDGGSAEQKYHYDNDDSDSGNV
jgi:hypothetical protein